MMWWIALISGSLTAMSVLGWSAVVDRLAARLVRWPAGLGFIPYMATSILLSVPHIIGAGFTVFAVIEAVKA